MRALAISSVLVICITVVVRGSSYGHHGCGQCPGNDCGLLPPELQYTCPNGNILDRCGCVKSCQCAGCPSFNASLPCPNGKKTDAHGCPLSECDCAGVSCPFINECLTTPPLEINCPAGNRLDGCGCLANCQCAGCPDIDLTIECPHGRKPDENNCPTDECNPAPCEFIGDCAAVTCLNGFAVDENSCPLRDCPCNPRDNCPAVVGCDIECPDAFSSGLNIGPVYKRDRSGCVKCECDCTNVPIISNDCDLGCEFRPTGCLNCPKGNRINECGSLVSCQCEGCPDITFGIECPFGRITDQNGCPTDHCKTHTIKTGSCPKFGGWGNKSCHDDHDCPGAQKCCRKLWKKNRTKVCVGPTVTVTHY